MCAETAMKDSADHAVGLYHQGKGVGCEDRRPDIRNFICLA
jgi:hypothetical protein